MLPNSSVYIRQEDWIVVTMLLFWFKSSSETIDYIPDDSLTTIACYMYATQQASALIYRQRLTF